MNSDIGSGSAFQTAAPYSHTLPRQAVAASWAAFCSRALGQDQMEVEFTSLHVFFTIQYGIDSTDSSRWQLEQPCKQGDIMLLRTMKRLLDQEAPKRFPKPGGWSKAFWQMAATEDTMVAMEEGSSPVQKHCELHTKVNNYKGLQDHQEWSDLVLKPALARYC